MKYDSYSFVDEKTGIRYRVTQQNCPELFFILRKVIGRGEITDTIQGLGLLVGGVGTLISFLITIFTRGFVGLLSDNITIGFLLILGVSYFPIFVNMILYKKKIQKLLIENKDKLDIV